MGSDEMNEIWRNGKGESSRESEDQAPDRRFKTPKELQKLVRLALVENSSGKHSGETRIGRRGRRKQT